METRQPPPPGKGRRLPRYHPHWRTMRPLMRRSRGANRPRSFRGASPVDSACPRLPAFTVPARFVGARRRYRFLGPCMMPLDASWARAVAASIPRLPAARRHIRAAGPAGMRMRMRMWPGPLLPADPARRHRPRAQSGPDSLPLAKPGATSQPPPPRPALAPCRAQGSNPAPGQARYASALAVARKPGDSLRPWAGRARRERGAQGQAITGPVAARGSASRRRAR